MTSRRQTNTLRHRSSSTYLILGITTLVAVAVVVFLVLNTRSPETDLGYVGPDASIPRGITEDGLPYLGYPDAPVTMRIYEDLGCPNCRNFFRDVEPEILENFVAKGRVRLVTYTLAFVNPSVSLPGAEAAACALDQGKYWEYRSILFSNQGVKPFNRQNLTAWAEESGMERAKFTNCFDQALHQQAIIEHSQRAFDFGITGTPTSEIDGVRYVGVLPFDSQGDQPGIKQILEEALIEAEE